jgi:hypothetical protein
LPYQQKKHVCMYCIILYSKNGTAWVIQFWYVLIYYGAKKFLRSWLYQVAIFKKNLNSNTAYVLNLRPFHFLASYDGVVWIMLIETGDNQWQLIWWSPSAAPNRILIYNTRNSNNLSVTYYNHWWTTQYQSSCYARKNQWVGFPFSQILKWANKNWANIWKIKCYQNYNQIVSSKNVCPIFDTYIFINKSHLVNLQLWKMTLKYRIHQLWGIWVEKLEW